MLLLYVFAIVFLVPYALFKCFETPTKTSSNCSKITAERERTKKNKFSIIIFQSQFIFEWDISAGIFIR